MSTNPDNGASSRPALTHTPSGSSLPPTNGTSQPHIAVGGTTTSDKVKDKSKDKTTQDKPSNVFKVSRQTCLLPFY